MAIENCIFPTAYFGPLDYYYFLLHTTHCKVEHHESYQKQSYRNRCSIYGPNGRQNLSIPVKAPNHTITREVKIDNSVPWQKQHWRAISTAYGSAPFFIYYDYEIQVLFEKNYLFLVDFNAAALEISQKFLKTEKSPEPSSSFEKKPQNTLDLRELLHPKKKPLVEQKAYPQVFAPKTGFLPNLSILDLIYNLGPGAKDYLMGLQLQMPDFINTKTG